MVAAPRRRLIAGLVALGVVAWALFPLLRDAYRSIRYPPPPFPHGVVRVGVDTSFPPFALDVNGELSGLDIDLGRALADEIGLPVRFVPIGFDGLYDALTTDRADLLISALRIDPRRTQEVRYTRPYFDNGLVLVTEAASITTMQDVAGQRLAFEFGSAADNEARQYLRRVQPFTTLPYELPRYALDAVRLGHADAALVDATSYFLYQREHPAWQPQHNYITSVPYAIAVRLDRTPTFDTVDAALADLQASGQLQQIINRWLS